MADKEVYGVLELGAGPSATVVVSGAVLTLGSRRLGVETVVGARIGQVLGAGVVVTAVIAGFFKLWDASLPLNWDVLGFLFLAATAFAAVQAGLLQLLGVRGCRSSGRSTWSRPLSPDRYPSC